MEPIMKFKYNKLVNQSKMKHQVPQEHAADHNSQFGSLHQSNHPESLTDKYGPGQNKLGDKLLGREITDRSADRRGMARRRENEDGGALKSVALQYSNKVPSGNPNIRNDSPLQVNEYQNADFVIQKNSREKSSRKELIKMAENQIKMMESQAKSSGQSQKNGQGVQGWEVEQSQAKNPPIIKDNNRLMTEEQYIALNKQLKESKETKRRSNKLTLGNQTSKTQTISQNHRTSMNHGENDRDIVSQYLNIPINPDKQGSEEFNPTANRNKSNRELLEMNKHSVATVVKKNSDLEVQSKRKSDIMKNQKISTNRVSMKQLKLSENNINQHGGQPSGLQTVKVSEQGRDLDRQLQKKNSSMAVRTRSTSKQMISSSRGQKPISQQNLFQSASNAQNVDYHPDRGRNPNDNQRDTAKSTERLREQVKNFQNQRPDMDQAANQDSKQESNSKFYDFLGYMKKNFFEKKTEESPDHQDQEFQRPPNEMRSQNSNDSPNAGFESNQAININGTTQYQLRMKRAGVGVSPTRDTRYNQFNPQGAASKNYGDHQINTQTQQTIEHHDKSHRGQMNMGPFNQNIDRVENDPLRLQNTPFSDQSFVPPSDISAEHTDNQSELRRIQRKSQQETKGLHILQHSKQARSQHNYLGGQVSSTNSQKDGSTKNNVTSKSRPMFKVQSQSQSQSNKKNKNRQMSNVVVPPPQADLVNRNQDSVEEPEWVQEVDLRKVKDAADMAMLKSQQRRSDLNQRLLKQIDQYGSDNSSPLRAEVKDQAMHFTNRANIHENLSHYRKSMLPENTNQNRQVNLFGEIKGEQVQTPNKEVDKKQKSSSPPNNDDQYNLMEADSSDNLHHNQNHQMLNRQGLQKAKTSDITTNVDAKTPVQNSRISNYNPQNQSNIGNSEYWNQNSYQNAQSKSSCSIDQQNLKHRGEEPDEYNYQYSKRIDSMPAGMKSRMIIDAFNNEDTTKYDQRMNKFLQGQQNLTSQGSERHGNDGVRNTAHFNGDTEQDIVDPMQYSSKPTDDKMVMKNRGHTKSKQYESTFLEQYGKNHIRSEQVSDRGLFHRDLADAKSNGGKSPRMAENSSLFEGLQKSLNSNARRHDMRHMQSQHSTSGQVKSYNIDKSGQVINNQLSKSEYNHQNSLPPMGPSQTSVATDNSMKMNNDSQKNVPKYAIKSKSPRNKVGQLKLLLRGKSQNRIDSRGQLNKLDNKNQGLSDQGFFPQSKVRDRSIPNSSRYNQPKEIAKPNDNYHERGQRGNGQFQDKVYNPQRSNKMKQSAQEPPKVESGVTTMFTFFKNMFAQDVRDSSQHRNDRQSAETKASSGQSALQRNHQTFNGWSPQEALEKFGHDLTEFEKIELGNFLRIYTIGSVRRENQYSIADKDGFYNTRPGEHLGYRYLIKKIIDKGSFGQVVACVDCADPNQRIVAAKIGKNKKFDVDNANIEIKFLSQLNDVDKHECADIEGHDRIVKFKDSFNFRQHVIIIFEHLHMNLYKYISLHKKRKPIFDQALLKRISYQMIQGLKYMKNKSIIHCDMKPENIIFTDQKCQNIKIIDFGASCTDCASGFFYVQSRYYRAPEIVMGVPYDHAVDIWSLGCIIYELITGRPIFPAKDENELLEFFTITIGNLPEKMLTAGKNYKKFYKKQTSIFGSVSHELIRSKKTILGSKLKERSEPIRSLLEKFEVSEDIVDFIEKCLVYEPECRITPHDALFHQWFFVKKPVEAQVPPEGQDLKQDANKQ